MVNPVANAGVANTLETCLADARKCHADGEYGTIPLLIVELGIRSQWATEHPSLPVSPQPVRNEGSVNDEVDGGARVSNNNSTKQRGVIKVDGGIDRSQARVQQSTAAKICHDPDHLSYECPDRVDSDKDDTKGSRDRSTSRRPRRDKTSSNKDVDNSGGKSRGDGEASCSMVGVAEPTVSLAPKAGEDFQAVAAAVQANPMAVLLDSGCSHHLMGTKAVFVDMATIDGVKHVRGFNGALHPVEGCGTVVLQGEAGKRVLIPDVLYVPGIQANVLSAGQLKESGVQLRGNGDEMLLVAATGEVLGRARYNGRVLCTDLCPCSMRSSRRRISTGLHITPLTGADPPCVSCVGGKLARHTFPDKGSDAEGALAVVHIDLCGPFRAKKSVLMLCSDRGGEFLGKEFTDFGDGKGIVHGLTCPYTPQQNGMVEREMRTAVESVRTMLLHMDVQHHWWHLALRQAVRVLNCLERSKTSSGTTSYQLLTAKKPDLTLARVWGCMVQFMVPEQQCGGKLAPKACWGVHLGMSPESKGWEVLDLTDNKVVMSVEVIFYETLSLEVWKVMFGPASGRTQTHPPMDTSTATVPLLTKVDEPADEDIVEVLPPPLVLAPPFLVVDWLASTPVSATGDEGSLEVLPVAPASGIAGSRQGAKLADQYGKSLTTGEQQTGEPVEQEAAAGVQSTGELPKSAGGEQLVESSKQLDIATRTVKEALASWKGEAVKAAMEEEIRSLVGIGTWELVERRRGVNIMKNRWVLTTKYRLDDSVKHDKVRLVVKGFMHVCGADYNETYSPVSSYVTLRIFLGIVAVFDLNLMQLDMKNAFLQSQLDRVLYMYQPAYFDDGSGRVCKLLKSLYGLKQSPLLWYRALDGVLLGAGWKKSQVDEALYFKASDDGVTCWVLVYVGDLLAASSSPAMLKELKQLLEDASKEAVAGAAGAGGAAGVGAACTGAGGVAGVVALSAVSRGTARPRPYYVPLLQQVLGLPPSHGPTPPLLSPSPSRSALPVRTARAGRRVLRQRPPPVPGTHCMTLRPSTAPQRVPLLSPPTSSLLDGPDPESDSLRVASPSITCFLATAVTDPLFESTAASALVAELVDYAAAYRLDNATSLVAKSASATVCPPSVEGECALGTDVLEDRQEEFECFATAGEAAAGFSACLQGAVLLHIAAHSDHELHSFDFSIAFLQGSLHKEIWVRRPPGFTGSFPPGTQTILATLGFAPSTSDLSLFLRTDTTLLPFYVLVYVDDLVFANAETQALAHTQSHMVQQDLQRFGLTYSSPQSTPLPTGPSLSALPSNKSVEMSGLYPELVGCLMYLMTCTRPDLAYPLSLQARYVAPGRHRKVHLDAAKRVLRYMCSTSSMGLVLGGRA
ncbi:unnamed protein product [Closterium sp. NIES-53]